MRSPRRRLLAIAGGGISAVLAGCLADDDATAENDGNGNENDGESDESPVDSSLPDDAVRDEPTVNYPGFVDDEVDVLETVGRIDYTELEVAFEFAVDGGGYDQPAESDPLQIGDREREGPFDEATVSAGDRVMLEDIADGDEIQIMCEFDGLSAVLDSTDV